MLWMMSTWIKTNQRVVHNFPSDLSQNCLFVAFTPLLGLDVGSDQLSVFFLFFFVFQGVGGSPGVPAKPRNHPPSIGERVVTFLNIASLLFRENFPVSFPPASRQDLDPRVPDKEKLQVPARRNLEFGPWNRAPFQEMETSDKEEDRIGFRVKSSITVSLIFIVSLFSPEGDFQPNRSVLAQSTPLCPYIKTFSAASNQNQVCVPPMSSVLRVRWIFCHSRSISSVLGIGWIIILDQTFSAASKTFFSFFLFKWHLHHITITTKMMMMLILKLPLKNFLKTLLLFQNREREKKRIFIERNREEGHDKLWHDYFSETLTYPHYLFQRRFRMNKHLFMRIVHLLST